MTVSAPRDVANIINFAGLIAPCCQPQPCTHRSGGSEVSWILDRGNKGGGSNCTNSGDGHQYLTCIALPGRRNELAIELRSAAPDTTPSLEQGQDDPFQANISAQQVSYIRFKYQATAFGHNQSKCLHES